MKLQKMLSRKYKDKSYYKYIIVIPGKDIIKSNLKDGDELQIDSKDGELKIRKL